MMPLRQSYGNDTPYPVTVVQNTYDPKMQEQQMPSLKQHVIHPSERNDQVHNGGRVLVIPIVSF